jgi:hypothetical protein
LLQSIRPVEIQIIIYAFFSTHNLLKPPLVHAIDRVKTESSDTKNGIISPTLFFLFAKKRAFLYPHNYTPKMREGIAVGGDANESRT